MKKWPAVTLRDVAEKVTYGFTASSTQIDTGVRFLRITDIASSSIDWDNVPYCNISDEDYRKYKLSTDDIVVARTGATVGYAKQVRKLNHRAVYASYLIKVKIKDGICARFIGALVESQLYKDFVLKIAGGAAQPNANASDLCSFPFFLPPIDIQQKIASILSAYDDLIENNKRRIAILEKMAEEIYREWFVRMRFPASAKATAGKPSQGSRRGLPPGWMIKTIGELCSRVTDGSHFSPAEVEDGKPMVSVKDMTSFGFDIGSAKRISDVDFDKLVKSDCQPLFGDVLIAKDGSYLKHVFVWTEDYEVVLLSSIAILRPAPTKILPYFFALTLKQDSTKEMMAGYVSGSALPRIILSDFKKMKILVPDMPLLKRFEEIISPLYQQIQILLKQSEKLTTLRDLLLPRLISGKLSVENLELLSNEKLAPVSNALPQAELAHA